MELSSVPAQQSLRKEKLLETVLVISSVLLWLIVLANVFLTLALIRRLNRTGSTALEGGLKAGTTAPAFTAQTLQGATRSLADYIGRAVVLIFLSPNCGPCRERLPMLQKTAVEASTDGVEFVLVSGGSLEETQSWQQEATIQLPLLVATQDQNPFFKDYEITSTPSFCLLDPDGRVRGAGIVGLVFEEWKDVTRSRSPIRV